MSLLLAALFFLQGIPVGARQGGNVSGVLRGADGKPLAYVRVAAVALPETIDDRSSAAMSGIAETDEQGRYSIEGIPQGRYYIAAGRVDFPTYYPGTPEMKTAVILSVMPGSVMSGIDFVMDDSSTRVQQGPGGGSSPLLAVIPVQISVTDGGRIPLFSNGQFIRLRFTDALNAIAASLNVISLSLQSQAEYDVRVEGLPQDYAVQSMTYGSIDLQTTRLKVPPVRSSGTTASPPISIVLRALPPAPPTSGVRVSGRTGKNTRIPQSVYLSGVPGTLYADGTFDFRGVPPGKHVLAGLDTASPLGALVVVGDRDVTGIELRDEVSPLPFNMRAPRDPEPAGAAPAGSVVPLASVRGTLREATTQKPIFDCEIKITGYAKTESFIVDSNGRFQIPRLFPGSYTIDFEAFGHENVSQTLTVGTENITLDLTSRRLY